MQIKKRLQINVVVSVLTALFICLMLFMALHRVNRAMDASNLADEIVRSIFERSTFREDYLRTNSERAKAQWFAKQEQIGRLLKTATEVFTDSEDRRSVDELIKDHESIGKLFSNIVENREKTGSDAGSAALSLEIENRLHTQLIMRLYDKILHARKLQEAGNGFMVRSLRQAGGGIVCVLAILIAAAGISSWTMSRTIADRVRSLRDGAAVIGGGDLDHRIDIEGDDEFTDISGAFNAMTVKLRGSYHDLEKEIEERKQAEEALRKAHDELELRVLERTKELSEVHEMVKAERQRLYGVLETLPVYVVLMTRDYHVPFANRFFRERFGESGGKRCYEYLFNRSEPCEICETCSVLKTNAPHHWEWIGPDGHNYDIFDYPFIDSDGSGMILEMGIDITERKQAEKSLEEINETLEQRIAERTIELQAVNTKLLDSRRGALNMMEDAIIARRQAEEVTAKLRNSEARYRTLFETMSEGFSIDEIICDDTGKACDLRYLEVNPAFEHHTGLKTADIVGRTVRELFPETEPLWIEQYGKVALTGEAAHFEAWFGPLGRCFEVSAYQTEPGRLAVVFFDITARKKAEEGLKNAHYELEKRVAERTAELEKTVATLHEEIVVRETAEERIRRLNRLYAVLSETDQTIVRSTDRDTLFCDFCRIAVEHGGFLLSWVGLVNSETGKVEMVTASGATGYLDDIRISTGEEPGGLGPTGISVREGTFYICNDFQNDPCTAPWHEMGEAHGIRASASVALKQEGEVIGALTLYADKKDFFDREQEKLLLQMGTEMSFALDNLVREARRREAEQALQEETLERLRAVEDLREKERLLIQQSRQAAMGEMINNIAHQWRQPLNTLGLLVQQLPLLHQSGDFSIDSLGATVDKAMQVIFHMSHTIDDFRNFFRPDKEKIDFRVRQVMDRAISIIEGSLKEHRIIIDVTAKDDPFINGYPNEYSQVLLNILLNARDALIERRIDTPRVEMKSSVEDGKSVVTIADNGGGIPEDIMDKIFDPYFTTKGPDKGTGVGLFMSKTIIEKNMNGRITARNTGDGAEFRIEV